MFAKPLNPIPVSRKERSFEIFGEEKTLDDISFCRFLEKIGLGKDKGTRELSDKLTNNLYTDVEVKRYAEKIVGSKNLLRKYVGKDLIEVSAYKNDQNPDNSGYRKWKETQINNSGAEKFVVYFAVILSLINYTRSSQGRIQDKELCSALILDNPFGATSSKMMREGRIKYFAAADYRENSEIENLVKAIILKTKANEDLEQIHYRNKKEHMVASRGVSDLEKQNAIIALENSSNFANSRSAVEILRGYLDWTQAEIETLADIALKTAR